MRSRALQILRAHARLSGALPAFMHAAALELQHALETDETYGHIYLELFQDIVHLVQNSESCGDWPPADQVVPSPPPSEPSTQDTGAWLGNGTLTSGAFTTETVDDIFYPIPEPVPAGVTSLSIRVRRESSVEYSAFTLKVLAIAENEVEEHLSTLSVDQQELPEFSYVTIQNIPIGDHASLYVGYEVDNAQPGQILVDGYFNNPSDPSSTTYTIYTTNDGQTYEEREHNSFMMYFEYKYT